MLTPRRAFELGAMPLLGYAVFDTARVLGFGHLLRRMKREHPAMFDGPIAAANIALAIDDAQRSN